MAYPHRGGGGWLQPANPPTHEKIFHHHSIDKGKKKFRRQVPKPTHPEMAYPHGGGGGRGTPTQPEMASDPPTHPPRRVGRALRTGLVHLPAHTLQYLWLCPCLRVTSGTKKTYVTENLSVSHCTHMYCNRTLEQNVQANFSKFWRSSLPIRGITSSGIAVGSKHMDVGAVRWSARLSSASGKRGHAQPQRHHVCT